MNTHSLFIEINTNQNDAQLVIVDEKVFICSAQTNVIMAYTEMSDI